MPYHRPDPSRPTTSDLAGLLIVIAVIVTTTLVIYAVGPVWGVAAGLVLTCTAIIIVTLREM